MQQNYEAIRNLTPNNVQQKANVKMDLKDAWHGGKRIKTENDNVVKLDHISSINESTLEMLIYICMLAIPKTKKACQMSKS